MGEVLAIPIVNLIIEVKIMKTLHLIEILIVHSLTQIVTLPLILIRVMGDSYDF